MADFRCWSLHADLTRSVLARSRILLSQLMDRGHIVDACPSRGAGEVMADVQTRASIYPNIALGLITPLGQRIEFKCVSLAFMSLLCCAQFFSTSDARFRSGLAGAGQSFI